jgi:hypothetical protein
MEFLLSIPLIAWDPNCGAVRLDKELCISFNLHSQKEGRAAELPYPRNWPVGVRAAETIYTGGRLAIVILLYGEFERKREIA